MPDVRWPTDWEHEAALKYPAACLSHAGRQHEIRRMMTMAKLTWQAVEDNGGGLHLAVFGGDGRVIYYNYGYQAMGPGALLRDIEALRAGEHPIAYGWELPADIDDPQEAYDSLRIGETNGGVVVADQNGVYRDRMGSAAVWAMEPDWIHDPNPDWDRSGTVAESWCASYMGYTILIDRFRDSEGGGYAYTVLLDGYAIRDGENMPADDFDDAATRALALLALIDARWSNE